MKQRNIRKNNATLVNATWKISMPAYDINTKTRPIESSKIGYLQGIFVLQCLHFPPCKMNENSGINSLAQRVFLQ